MSKRFKDSLKEAIAVITIIATGLTIIGFSLKDLFPFQTLSWYFAIILRTIILTVILILFTVIIFIVKGSKYKNKMTIHIGKNSVTVMTGDLFKEDYWRVIPMDTHFETVVDDKVISKKSLHGQLILNHGNENDIKEVIKEEAKKRHIELASDGKYHFELGTVIPYECEDGHYLMVALTRLDEKNEAHTTMSEYEYTLMKMWKNINGKYGLHRIVLPVLGSGITRFDDNQDDVESLMRCMLCTLNTSKVYFKSDICIVIHEDCINSKESLYELKNVIRIAKG